MLWCRFRFFGARGAGAGCCFSGAAELRWLSKARPHIQVRSAAHVGSFLEKLLDRFFVCQCL